MYHSFGYSVYRQVWFVTMIIHFHNLVFEEKCYFVQVLRYYSGEEDAYGEREHFPPKCSIEKYVNSFSNALFLTLSNNVDADMRKAMERDKAKESIVPLPKPITPDMLETD